MLSLYHAPSDAACLPMTGSRHRQSSFDFDRLLEPARIAVKAGPRIVRSVSEEAGLERFIYLEGKTRRRYVFSRIERGQAGLYCDAVFAVAGVSPASIRVCELADLSERPRNRDQLYVHLLTQDDAARDDVLRDLDRYPDQTR